MISPDTYSSNFYSAPPVRPAGQPFALKHKNDVSEAAAAADFERILKGTAPLDAVPVKTSTAKSASPASDAAPAEEHSFLSFIKGVIDIINPLQHIPVISTIYRHITGDTISPAAELAGSALYGGPIGGALALADIAYKKTTGKDFGESVIAGLSTKDTNLPAAAAPTLLPPAAAKTERLALHSYAPTAAAPVLPPQAASAEMLRKSAPPMPVLASYQNGPVPVPKDLVAVKMMEALDKYREMKTTPPPSQIIWL